LAFGHQWPQNSHWALLYFSHRDIPNKQGAPFAPIKDGTLQPTTVNKQATQIPTAIPW
jgi:hypothetical protein